MNTRICAAVVAVVALTAGCAGEPAAAPPPSTTTTTTTAAPTPAELNERAKAAIAPADAVAGGEMKTNEPATEGEIGADGQAVTMICGSREIFVDGTSVSRTRVWSGAFQRVHAMADRTAITLIKSVETGLVSCTTAHSVEQFPLPKPDGVDDFYAYCEATLKPDLLPFSCHALMGRGTLISEVVTFGSTKAVAGVGLTAVVPAFARSFAKA